MFIKGYNNSIIRTKSIQNNSDTLVVLYPGLEYSLNSPIFYYMIRDFKEKQLDILGIDYRYLENDEYIKLPKPEQEKHLYFDSHAISQYVTEYTKNYKRVFFIGKSLGTVFLLNQLKTGQIPSDSEIVWLTPAIDFNEFNSLKNKNLLIYGTLDPFYLKQKDINITENENLKIITLSNAGHSFEVDGNLQESITNNYLVIEAVINFLE